VGGFPGWHHCFALQVPFSGLTLLVGRFVKRRSKAISESGLLHKCTVQQ